jgi:hypothetical protein
MWIQYCDDIVTQYLDQNIMLQYYHNIISSMIISSINFEHIIKML